MAQYITMEHQGLEGIGLILWLLYHVMKGMILLGLGQLPVNINLEFIHGTHHLQNLCAS